MQHSLAPLPSPSMTSLLLPLLLAGCASTLRYPGPVSWVGRAPPPVAHRIEELEETEPTPADEPVAVAEVLSPEPPPGREPRRRRPDPLGRDIASAARYNLEHRPSGFRDDCSGFASAALTRAGFEITGSTRSLYEGAKAARATHRRPWPHPGDLAFFDNTYDRDRDGRWDDELTHVGVVMDIEEDGTVVIAHAGTSKGRSELRLNLEHPDVHVDSDGRVLNDYLRRPGRGDDDKSRYLAGQLWRSWATPRAEDLDTWRNP